ncbi:MAG: magnesium transporter [Gammaproteobacteria bacterium]|nr:magnesium transporter [Gammaproteobacteria bacterium]
MSAAAAIENEYIRRHPAEAAELLDALPTRDLEDTVSGLDAAALAVAMEYLSPLRDQTLFNLLEQDKQLEVLERAVPRVVIAILGDLPAERREALLEALRPGVRDDLTRLLAFPENTAGRLMERSFVGAQADLTVGETLRRLQESPIRRARSLFIVTADQRLAGRVDMQDLALAAADEPLRSYMQPVEGVVTAMAPREEVVDLLDRSRLDSVPVVDGEGKLMGVVRYRTLFRAIEDVASADMQKMVGVSADERALSTAGFSVKRRLPWLHINLLTAFLAASVVGIFEDLIAQFTALAVLLPVVAGQSGNAGSQALAVTIRGLALKEIGLRDWRKVMNKELLVGTTNGVALALTCGLAVYVWSGTLGLALVIGVAMILSMVAAGISGALVPILLTRVGQDPATASSIILTTVTDVAGFFSFLGTATLLAFML